MLLTQHSGIRLYIPDRCKFVIDTQAVVPSNVPFSKDRSDHPP